MLCSPSHGITQQAAVVASGEAVPCTLLALGLSLFHLAEPRTDCLTFITSLAPGVT